MKLSEKKILVTGADGFIGSHLVEELVRNGYNTKAFVFYNSDNSWGWLDSADQNIKSNIEVVSGDVRDYHGVKAAMMNCDIVFHLASLIAIPYSYVAPDSYVETNIKGTLNIVQAARELGLGRMIHTSTSEVYGTAQFVPIHEDHPLQGQSPYAATKIGADQLALSFHKSFGTPVSIVRPFNTYGPRQSARAVIPTIMTQIASGQRVVRLGSLSPTRDFNFVKDTVSGFIKAAESDRSIGEVINIGSNYEISIGELVQLIAEVMGTEVSIVEEQTRLRPVNSEVERLWADNSKAKALIQWEPAYGGKEGLRRGLMETKEWLLTNGNLQRFKANNYNI